MAELDRGDWRLSYDVSGHENTATSLFLHDIGTDRRVWHALAKDMGSDFRVIAPDLRGLGASGQPAEHANPQMADYATDLIALLKHLRVEGCAVIGAGFGAEVALKLALTEPELVQSLVISGATPVSDHATYDDRLRKYEQARWSVADAFTRFGSIGAGVFVAKDLVNPSLRAAMRARYNTFDARGLTAAMSARRERGNSLTVLSLLTMPCLVVTGEEDPLRSAAELLEKTLPRARLITIADCGAGAPFVAPKAFESCLGAFFADVRAGNEIRGHHSA